ncbi:MAG: amino acid permease [Candidatus Aramenus sulfurataquae]|uniref:Amino acid permease n=1 Tax=Candidatus Aramenus sulfurataquae TaxID=1326980 RepID=W7KTV8_9CREN|nr:MAG: amino acid permease [Candidatus Aramenus sulfurataquae]
MIYFLVVGLVGTFKQKRFFLLAGLSIFTARYFAFLTYESVINPVFSFVSNGTPDPITLGFVIGSYVVGALIYLASNY